MIKEGVDYILGVQEKLKLFEYFQAPGKKKQPLIAVQMVSETREADLHPVGNYQNQTRAFLKIQNGCDRRCAYCIVPIARGASRSVPKESVIEQAQKLIKEKFKEIVLTGVHVGDYGKEIHPERCSMLPQLLDELAAVSGNARFRISSTDPGDMTEELIEVIAQQSNICRHFHIPIQSGCNAVLKNMNRNYTVEYVADVIEQIQSKIGIVGLGADVIVGFPGETDEQFEETYQFIQNQLFSYLHVFPFSIRKGTAAAVMKNKVDSKIIAKRAQKLRQLGNEKKRQWLSQWNGKTVDVLLENRNLNGRMGGFTSEYARVEIPYQANLSNQLIPVKIIGQTSSILKGKIEEG